MCYKNVTTTFNDVSHAKYNYIVIIINVVKNFANS